MSIDNVVLATDSYKLTHYKQYPQDTEVVYSYFESRKGAKYDKTVFFGLQHILKTYLAGHRVTRMDVDAAERLAKVHFGNNDFNREGWMHIVNEHDGKLPLRIKAVPEGTPVPVGNVLMTVENTCDLCYWLTNAVESLLTHVWYPSTVASLSRHTKEMISQFLEDTGGSQEGLKFMLHDFGYRGASSHESAAIGGAGHLVNFVGTDTLPAMLLAIESYSADINQLGFSVPATEHSVMTARGREGEFEVLEQLLDEYPAGILSVVSDSYDITHVVNTIGTEPWRSRILERDGVFVVRPDSITAQFPTPEDLVLWIIKTLAFNFGFSHNDKRYKVLDPHVRILWGDGIGPEGIEKILQKLKDNGYAAENMVFGMGGGLLQKVNRDTQRFAFKSSAQKRSGHWHDICKEPLDASKASKKGRLALVRRNGTFETVSHTGGDIPDQLREVFLNGELRNIQNFQDIRKQAVLS